MSGPRSLSNLSGRVSMTPSKSIAHDMVHTYMVQLQETVREGLSKELLP